ncbi:hypothetical protein DM01DRAFT_1408634 [Hesseltinella vesiculosa]|uniref:DASH complex subunit ASK1 n=1 Tax=Hesseltinella vesiculosa TaxID=101127 RepID=A0A1X2GE88_9FUNG|nr:hypothetical protein DM01DRAFT_1408634 [Hesseltinella vesiculosa]
MNSMTEEEAAEKLEKLQQNITLTLQEIDQNFAKCNHIVTSSLLPELERYRLAVKEIWNSSKLWLCFFQSLDQLPDTSSLHDNVPKPSPFTFEAISKLYGHRSPWMRLQRDLYETMGTTDMTSIVSKGLLRPGQIRPTQPATMHDDLTVARQIGNEILQHSSEVSTADSPVPLPTFNLMNDTTGESSASSLSDIVPSNHDGHTWQ